jgi:hypothetical protein
MELNFTDRKRALAEEVSSLPSIVRRGTHFGKQLELLLTRAKVDGCKPSFQARLRYVLSICLKYV